MSNNPHEYQPIRQEHHQDHSDKDSISFIDILMEKYKMGVDGHLLAELTPVIVVQRGNPKNISGVKDLARADVDVILTDYERSSLGHMLSTIFRKAGIDLAELNRKKRIVTNKSGGYAANYVKMKNADAAIVWNAVAYLRRDALDTVPITQHLPTPHVDAVTSATGKSYRLTPMRVTAATLKCSRRPQQAKAFLDYIASDEADRVFGEFGFTMSGKRRLYVGGREVAADVTGVVKLYAGAGLRRAVDKLVKVFESETGIRVEPDYGGSGMILTRARESGDADLFMPGDVWYVDRLHELAGTVERRTMVSYFVPVIIVQKGNPGNIRALEDFFRDDVSVALGRSEACQIGRITGKIMDMNGLDRTKLNAKEALTVNELGVWVKMKDVDAAIVWDAIANNIADDVETIEIPKEKNIVSKVSVGLLSTARNRSGAIMFLDFMTGETGRSILKKSGYRVDQP